MEEGRVGNILFTAVVWNCCCKMPALYAYIAAWRANRSTFLGPAYFMLYPDHKLMDRPLLSQSATFFLWLRISYPSFKEKLVDAIGLMKKKVQDWALDNAMRLVRGSADGGVNLDLAKYVHLLNLRSIFEFSIPAIQDYGCTLSKEMTGQRSFEPLLV